jgi:hypothetical protein
MGPGGGGAWSGRTGLGSTPCHNDSTSFASAITVQIGASGNLVPRRRPTNSRPSLDADRHSLGRAELAPMHPGVRRCLIRQAARFRSAKGRRRGGKVPERKLPIILPIILPINPQVELPVRRLCAALRSLRPCLYRSIRSR